MKPRPGRIMAFSLVEVVLAMAVIAFCLVTLLGLFSTGLVNSKRSTDDTNLAGIIWQVTNTLRGENAANLTLTNYYFDISGQLTNAPSYYTCALSHPSASTFSAINDGSATTFTAQNFTNVEVVISYPGHASTNYVTIPPP